jgi:hypothetical protein
MMMQKNDQGTPKKVSDPSDVRARLSIFLKSSVRFHDQKRKKQIPKFENKKSVRERTEKT